MSSNMLPESRAAGLARRRRDRRFAGPGVRRRRAEGPVPDRARRAGAGFAVAARHDPQGAGAGDRRFRAASRQSRIWRRQRVDPRPPAGRRGRSIAPSPSFWANDDAIAGMADASRNAGETATRRRCGACEWRSARCFPAARTLRPKAARRGSPSSVCAARARSTLGRMLAEDLGFPFVELSREIEKLAGCGTGEILALYGQNALPALRASRARGGDRDLSRGGDRDRRGHGRGSRQASTCCSSIARRSGCRPIPKTTCRGSPPRATCARWRPAPKRWRT